MNKGRLEAFSDGVFAIVITLLILDIRFPEVPYNEFFKTLITVLPRILAECRIDGPYRPDPDQTGKRALGGAALGLITRLDGGAQAAALYASADNMTLQLSAAELYVLADVEHA